MIYSTEPKYRRYVKGYVVLWFARKFGNKYDKKLMDTATKTGIDAAKAVSKWVVQKTEEASGKSKEDDKTKTVNEIYIPPEKKQQITDDLRLF